MLATLTLMSYITVQCPVLSLMSPPLHTHSSAGHMNDHSAKWPGPQTSGTTFAPIPTPTSYAQLYYNLQNTVVSNAFIHDNGQAPVPGQNRPAVNYGAVKAMHQNEVYTRLAEVYNIATVHSFQPDNTYTYICLH